MAEDRLPRTVDENNPLPYIVYGLKRDGRIVYVGRGTQRRMEISAKERKAEPFLIEAHSGQEEQVKRERYWIQALRPEMNSHPGDSGRFNAAGNNVELPHYIRNGHVMFNLAVKIEAAYSYHALALALDEFAGNSHERAQMFERAVMEALSSLKGAA